MPDQHSSLAARQSRVCDNALAAAVHLGVRFAPELCLELGKDTHVLSACVLQAVVALAMYRRSTLPSGRCQHGTPRWQWHIAAADVDDSGAGTWSVQTSN